MLKIIMNMPQENNFRTDELWMLISVSLPHHSVNFVMRATFNMSMHCGIVTMRALNPIEELFPQTQLFPSQNLFLKVFIISQ